MPQLGAQQPETETVGCHADGQVQAPSRLERLWGASSPVERE